MKMMVRRFEITRFVSETAKFYDFKIVVPQGEKRFSLRQAEMNFVLDGQPFYPWFDDLSRSVRIFPDEIVIREVNGFVFAQEKRTGEYLDTHIPLPFLEEFVPAIKANMENWSDMFWDDLSQMAHKYAPRVKVEISPRVLKLINEYKLAPYIDGWVNMAENYSNGEQVNVAVGLGSIKWTYAPSFWWHIYYDKPKNERTHIINGGLIFHSNRLPPSPQHIRRGDVWQDGKRIHANGKVARQYGDWSVHT